MTDTFVLPHFSIARLAGDRDDDIRARIDSRTKPPGALGQLESLALQLARLYGSESPQLQQPTMLVFAGDHGVTNEGVSIASSAVTGQMVRNFLDGGASINAFCGQSDMALRIVDCGILEPLPAHPMLLDHRLGAGTEPIHLTAAMSEATVARGFANARQLIGELCKAGVNLIGLGEMGIGNTTSASALMAALTGLSSDECIGRGSGIDDKAFLRKQEIVTQALKRHVETFGNPVRMLAALGGFEIVGMTGAVLAAAERRMGVLVDGFITTVAALAACHIEPAARDYLIFAHCSGEKGHAALLNHLSAEPLLSLNLRMGEGSGAALALPLLRSALAFYNEMASFEQAGVVV
ncbi:nicotinate-nucleotide--dimethylbenzimidazole phosphoribosyltransferase [Kushneria phosphatilytica]|uniref:Nicotinate-nucleotide--dimethylbenzimidazole phosphoribosyltransferase n=1 Tax=Kushneria phosphatilytica TaxID=657387 RepID=A0A1S1NWX4_9GAMM|nr:nicotinate-nucleotide--dimethylbenzimidazole phosphoribosyltransferase [Kushneria phosphatilytica]OHV11876.1 nicotinate-nucleotide--dimethylbenzimidazole phosphoribosyltransferase [Kushneria phosphatilytica]QEL11049.1 nicotinate-nucleotide--dimethylbenzimidazole phosphoribosyltransferase [Kushneria phosphatilytica]